MKCRLLPLAFASLFSLGTQAQDYIVWNGGITSEERATAPTTGTKLVFFIESGSFLSDVKVRVKDMQGKVLVDTLSEGPWLILNLPAGQYSVRAEVDGSAQGGVITIEEGVSREFGYMFKYQ
jgi:hypothetical protein